MSMDAWVASGWGVRGGDGVQAGYFLAVGGVPERFNASSFVDGARTGGMGQPSLDSFSRI